MMTNTAAAGRVAVITGSNKGIGFYIALQLGLSGLFEHLVLACRDTARATAAVEQLQNQLPKTVKVQSQSLILGETASHDAFRTFMEETFGKIDVLVNNAAIAFKNADPTPFEQQTRPTLDINYRGTVDFTEKMIDLVKKGRDPRIVNVASMAGRLSQVSEDLQVQFDSDSLDLPKLNRLVDDFERSVQDGTYKQKGYSGSNYGMSKLAVVAYTKLLARQHSDVSINCCCPGYCKTDMSSQRGTRHPSDGAKNAVLPATMQNPPTGAFFADYKVSSW